MIDTQTDAAVIDMKLQVGNLATWADQLVVATQADADTALRTLADVKAARKRWCDYWLPLKKAANEAWKGIVAKEKEGTDLADQAEVVVKRKVLAWQEAERAKAEAEQRRLQAIADEQARRERERLEAQAARLKTPEKQAERLEQAAAVVAPVITVAAPRVAAAGAATVTRWQAELTDKAALLAAAAEDPNGVPAGLLMFDQSKADALARSLKGAVMIPGVRFRAVQGLSVRASQ